MALRAPGNHGARAAQHRAGPREGGIRAAPCGVRARSVLPVSGLARGWRAPAGRGVSGAERGSQSPLGKERAGRCDKLPGKEQTTAGRHVAHGCAREGVGSTCIQAPRLFTLVALTLITRCTCSLPMTSPGPAKPRLEEHCKCHWPTAASPCPRGGTGAGGAWPRAVGAAGQPPPEAGTPSSHPAPSPCR